MAEARRTGWSQATARGGFTRGAGVRPGGGQVCIHQSGERPAVRVRDKNNHLRKVFTGMKWYPVNTAYRVEGTFVPFDKPKTFQVPNMLGDIDTMDSPGHVTFTLNGKEHNMLAITEDRSEERRV